MKDSSNGWDNWYAQWGDPPVEGELEPTPDIIPYPVIAEWGQSFRHYILLNDHWTGYLHPEPMSLEDGMSIAFVLYDAGVNVDDLIRVLETFQPFEGTPIEIGIPLCWLTEPMDHVQDLLDMLADASHLSPNILEQTQQMLEEALGEMMLSTDELPTLFRTMVIGTIQWLLEMIKILGNDGMLALRAWWQGRLIILLRETARPKRKRSKRKGRSNPSEMPSAFRDLIQSLDFHGLDSDKDTSETDVSGAPT
jgi:hypothetical protein